MEVFFFLYLTIHNAMKAHVGVKVQVQILTFKRPCIVIYSYNKTNEMH